MGQLSIKCPKGTGSAWEKNTTKSWGFYKQYKVFAVHIDAGLSSLGVPGVPRHTQILADHLTLFQPGGTDYAHLQGAPYVFERFSEAVLRPWVDVEMKSYHIFLTQVYTFQIP